MFSRRTLVGIVSGLVVATVGFALHCGRTTAADKLVGKKLAFLVGINDYRHDKLDPLQFAERDVEELATVLKSYGYTVVVMTPKTGKTDPKLFPNRENVDARLGELLVDVGRNDQILVGLAGHGIQPDGTADGFYCPYDANPSIEPGQGKAPAQAKFPNSLVAITGKTGLIHKLEESGIGRKILFIDACRNDPESGRGGGVGSMITELPERTWLLLSCSSRQRAWETKKLGGGHGVFFHFVLEGLRGKAADNDGEVTWNRLAEYVTKQVERQVPNLIGEGATQSPDLKQSGSGVPVLAVLSMLQRQQSTVTLKSPEEPEVTSKKAPVTSTPRPESKPAGGKPISPEPTPRQPDPRTNTEVASRDTSRRPIKFYEPLPLSTTMANEGRFVPYYVPSDASLGLVLYPSRVLASSVLNPLWNVPNSGNVREGLNMILGKCEKIMVCISIDPEIKTTTEFEKRVSKNGIAEFITIAIRYTDDQRDPRQRLAALIPAATWEPSGRNTWIIEKQNSAAVQHLVGLFPSTSELTLALHAPDQRTILIGERRRISPLLLRNQPVGAVAKRLQQADARNDILLALGNFDRFLQDDSFKRADENISKEFSTGPFAEHIGDGRFIRAFSGITLLAGITGPKLFELQVQADDEDAAVRFQKIAEGALGMLRNKVNAPVNANDPGPPKEIRDFLTSVVNAAKLERDGPRVTVSLNQNSGLSAVVGSVANRIRADSKPAPPKQ